MCCYSKPKYVEALQKRISKNKEKWIYAYKVIIVTNLNNATCLSSIYYSRHYWQLGWNIADVTQDLSDSYSQIYHGIHVYLGYKIAIKDYKERLVRVKCYLDDLVGADKTTAVFNKVYLPKTQYEQAMRNQLCVYIASNGSV